ncbi:hypothetical protein FZ025_19775 [Xanthomonas hyacinthi]|nr:hypothetical protein FZ025_19775 [Xanthomonas hyacinthi]
MSDAFSEPARSAGVEWTSTPWPRFSPTLGTGAKRSRNPRGAIAMLLDQMHRIADNHQCFLTVALRDPVGGRHWD